MAFASMHQYGIVAAMKTRSNWKLIAIAQLAAIAASSVLRAEAARQVPAVRLTKESLREQIVKEGTELLELLPSHYVFDPQNLQVDIQPDALFAHQWKDAAQIVGENVVAKAAFPWGHAKEPQEMIAYVPRGHEGKLVRFRKDAFKKVSENDLDFATGKVAMHAIQYQTYRAQMKEFEASQKHLNDFSGNRRKERSDALELMGFLINGQAREMATYRWSLDQPLWKRYGTALIVPVFLPIGYWAEPGDGFPLKEYERMWSDPQRRVKLLGRNLGKTWMIKHFPNFYTFAKKPRVRPSVHAR